MTTPQRPPRNDLYRAMPGGITSDDGRTLLIRLAPYDQWAEIRSTTEGHFMERFSRTAYRKTMAEHPPKILFQHGKDPEIGEKPIATTDEVGEDATSPYARGRILAGVPELVVAGIREGVYGASHRFSVVREKWDDKPIGGPHNPQKLPERTISEAWLFELGPVTWPAYAGASVALRSLTDEYRGPAPSPEPEAPSLDAAAGKPHLEPERRDEPIVVAAIQPKENATVENLSVDEKRARDREITDELSRTASEYTGVLPADVQSRWDALVVEQDKLRADIAAVEARMARVEVAQTKPVAGATDYAPPVFNTTRRMSEGDIFASRWAGESSAERRDQVLRDDAMRAAEIASFPADADSDGSRDRLAYLLDHRDSRNKELARRVLATGSPLYHRAFNKYITGQMMSPEEQRGTALAVQVDATGGFLLPFAFDPSIIRIGAWATNPYRSVCRTEQIVGTDTWLGLTSTAVVATRADEAAAATEQGPTFAQPSILVTKVQGAITYSIETGEDRADLGAEMAGLIAEAKDNEEETAFSTGVGGAIGSKVAPIGFFAAHGTAGMYTHIDLTTAHTWAIGDVDNLEAALPIRHRTNAVWFMHRKTLRTIQGLETTGGRLFGGSQYPSVGTMATQGSGFTGLKLLGYPVYEAPSATYDVTVDDTPLAWLGDPRSYCIVDRVGINVEYIPHVFADAAGSLPTGQRRLYFYYRNSGKPINVDAGRLLVVLNA